MKYHMNSKVCTHSHMKKIDFKMSQGIAFRSMVLGHLDSNLAQAKKRPIAPPDLAMASKGRSKVVEMPRHPKGILPLQYHFLCKRRGSQLVFRCHVQNIRWIAGISMLLLSSTAHIRSSFWIALNLCLPSAIWILLQYASTKPFVGMQHTKSDVVTTTNCNRSFSGPDPQQWSWLTTSHGHPSSGIPKFFDKKPRLWAQQPQFFTKPAHQYPLQTVTIPLSSHVPPVDA